ncbi:hypothetical protein LWP59_08570 [Amycolatopsis acidiphila]|uniref:DUF4435 domain-containing protein n=1 Tax=Amycolatopsis acidiphila TaxID=715473 RepID=A0A558AD02_9PSEU|nr:hypothetical protein [Amycolatopsis acidiphila]TVT22137.1 hypothetical protein FNH06_14310 [Amycolatopsis acidiphila]UIJ61664.1 hypothetical protein LWP59_08570 [Amycolatopsis acidiphila]
MSDGTRRQIDEILTLLELDSTYHEIIVEGRQDVGIVLVALAESDGQAEVSVFAVDDRLDVPSSEFSGVVGESVGARGRVLAAARQVSEAGNFANITFIADADFGHVDDTLPSYECLLFTDYSSIELYCFEERVLTKFFLVGLRATFEIQFEELSRALLNPLVLIFLCRWALIDSRIDTGLVSALKKRCSLRGGVVDVDVKGLLRDAVQRDGPGRIHQRVGELSEKVSARFSSLSGDLRQYVRGHDFVELFVYYSSARWPELFRNDRAGFRKAEITAIALLLTLEKADLLRHEMFVRLLDRVGRKDEAA